MIRHTGTVAGSTSAHPAARLATSPLNIVSLRPLEHGDLYAFAFCGRCLSSESINAELEDAANKKISGSESKD
jgi:hypothetical protein